ncbi:hypothetical protein DCAR_0623509 [Daucus carota subsp. sativus]|uniref:Uncharacterized protein n=1 Tax=Daucus carota subsp. sativus TaxID=79200 RepID=A0AAF1B4A3_DAUCS|nr:hypothetical protein DCAR_0623509 [Daucus carota subsp. sativus]
MCQPLNSPDLNILDLGFLRAIQSLKYKEASKTIDDLVSGVEKAFNNFSVIKSDHIFLSLQLCMKSVLEEKGDNHYKIKHTSNDALRRRGRLPLQIRCDSQLVQNSLALL